MSNKTQLQTNNTNLDTLITRVNAAKDTAASLPDAGSSGDSASVETCTIEIINETLGKVMESEIEGLWFISYENGELKGYGGLKNWDRDNIWPGNFDPKAQKNIINNVVCNSMMYIGDSHGTLTLPQGWCINPVVDPGYLKIPSTPNVTHTLKLQTPF